MHSRHIGARINRLILSGFIISVSTRFHICAFHISSSIKYMMLTISELFLYYFGFSQSIFFARMPLYWTHTMQACRSYWLARSLALSVYHSHRHFHIIALLFRLFFAYQLRDHFCRIHMELHAHITAHFSQLFSQVLSYFACNTDISLFIGLRPFYIHFRFSLFLIIFISFLASHYWLVPSSTSRWH